MKHFNIKFRNSDDLKRRDETNNYYRQASVHATNLTAKYVEIMKIMQQSLHHIFLFEKTTHAHTTAASIRKMQCVEYQ